MKIDNALKVTGVPRIPVNIRGKSFYPDSKPFEVVDQWDMLNLSPAEPKDYLYLEITDTKNNMTIWASNGKIFQKEKDLKSAKKFSDFDEVVKEWKAIVARTAAAAEESATLTGGGLLAAIASASPEERESVRALLMGDK